jgi:23S rRNA pseudouridine2605 synthase
MLAMSEQRLQKILADAGVCSRRKAEDIIRAGRVSVNGRPASVGDKADPSCDQILLDDQALVADDAEYWLLHKPQGVLTTSDDPQGRPIVLDFLPDDHARVFPVGRLDLETEGLVLLTNDGSLAHVLLHPSLENEREYRVTVRGGISKKAITDLQAGIELEDGPTAPCKVERVERGPAENQSTFHMTLTEGRKRQIRRTLKALGYPVERLLRVRMGPLTLGRLAAGTARRLRNVEIEKLKRHAELLRERSDSRAKSKAKSKGNSKAKGEKNRT